MERNLQSLSVRDFIYQVCRDGKPHPKCGQYRCMHWGTRLSERQRAASTSIHCSSHPDCGHIVPDCFMLLLPCHSATVDRHLELRVEANSSFLKCFCEVCCCRTKESRRGARQSPPLPAPPSLILNWPSLRLHIPASLSIGTFSIFRYGITI